MNVKGLKMNRPLINLLASKGESIQVFKGIESFNNYVWTGFDKREFFCLIDAYRYLENIGLFSNLNDENVFIFNYSTDVTEMDIVTVLSDENGPIFIDIEVKNSEDLRVNDTMSIQINKRIKDHLPQLIKNNRFLVIGVVNNNFHTAHYYDGKQINNINDFAKLKEIILAMSQFNNVEEYLTKFSDMASISKVCSDIKKGEYKFFEETNKIYELFVSKINTNNAFVIYGNAGTGKSVLALRLFFGIENTKLLLMNSKLYYALELGGNLYTTERTTFNTKNFINSLNENTIAIVDECQRLSLEDIETIVSKAKITFLFGDNKQAFVTGNTLLSCDDLTKHLKSKGYIVSKKNLKKSRRYSDEVNKSLSFLTSKSMRIKEKTLLNNYAVNIYFEEKKFIDKYETCDGVKKLYSPTFDVDSNIEIGGKVFNRASKREDKFSLWSGGDNYYGTTYHALSFDVDHCFVYLPETIITSYKGKNFLFTTKKEKNSEDIDLYLNELNILFTRGKKSLNILVKDIETYLYLNEKILKIKRS